MRFYTGMGYQADDPGERFTQAFEKSRLAKLYGDYYKTGNADLGQLARFDPEGAARIKAEQEKRGLAGLLGNIYEAPEEQRQGLIAEAFRKDPTLGMNAAKMFDPRYATQNDTTPSDIRSLQALQANPELLKLDRERRQAASMVPKLVQTQQGYGWATPGNSIESAPMGGPAAPSQGDMEADIALANQMAKAGIDPDKIDAFIAARGQRAEAAPQIAQPREVITPYQQAQLQIQQAQEGRAQAEFQRKAANPINPQAQREQAAIRAKVPQLQNAIRGMSRIENALNKLDGKLVNTGPMDAMVQRFTPAGQELDAAVGAIQNSVLALTRVPGIGSQSDLEARIAALQYPSLDKPPETNRRTLENLKLFMRDLAEAYKLAVQPGTAEPAKASGGFRILPD